MQRLFALVMTCLFYASTLLAQDYVEAFDSPDTLASRWQVNRPVDANASVQDGRLVITHDYDMRYRPGVTMQTIEPMTITGKRILCLMKVGIYEHGTSTKKDLFNAYKFKLGDKCAQLSINRSVNKDVVRFFVEGKKVWDSYPFDRDRLFAPETYIGFEISGQDWKVICTDDPTHLKPMRQGKTNHSQGTFDGVPQLSGKHHLQLNAANVHGRKASWSIDQILLTQ